MDNVECEITEAELITYSELDGDIKEKLYEIIDPIFAKDVKAETIIKEIEVNSDNTELYVYVTENYRRCSYPNSFSIPIYALRNKYIFKEWMQKGYIDEQKQHEEYKIKLEQEKIEQEKQEYKRLKAKYENI